MAGGIGAITSLAGTAMSVMGAEEQKKQAQEEANAKAMGDYYQAWVEWNQSLQYKIKAAQTSTSMTQGLDRILNNISAIRASTGTLAESPTGMAVKADVLGRGEQDIRRSVRNIWNVAEEHALASQFYVWAAGQALSA